MKLPSNPLVQLPVDHVATNEPGDNPKQIADTVARLLDPQITAEANTDHNMLYEEKWAEVKDKISKQQLSYVIPSDSDLSENDIARIFSHISKVESRFFAQVFQKILYAVEHKDKHFSYIKGLLWVQSPEKIIVLWDIDETIANVDTQSKHSAIRPSFIPLVELLHVVLPDLEHGILSSRSRPSLERQLATNDEPYSLQEIAHAFNRNHVFSSDDFRGMNLGKHYDLYISSNESERCWLQEKVRAYHGVNMLEPTTYFLLVDDVLQPYFESIGAGVRIPDDQIFVHANFFPAE